MGTDESVGDVAQCDVCDHAMTPKSPLADGHICRTCLLDIQVGDRIAE